MQFLPCLQKVPGISSTSGGRVTVHSALDHLAALEVQQGEQQELVLVLITSMAAQPPRQLPSSAISSGGPTTMLPLGTSLQLQALLLQQKDQGHLLST
jgi:hypothetical protein